MYQKANVDKWTKHLREFRYTTSVEVYREWLTENIAGRLKHYFSEANNARLLDVGCGKGEVTALLAEKTGFEVIGFDIVDDALHACKKLLEEKELQARVSLVKSSVYQLPFRDDVFDMATSTGGESTGTFRGAPEEVSRLVVREGPIFLEYVRMPNLYLPITSVKSYFRYKRMLKKYKRGWNIKYPNYETLGLSERFEDKLGLTIGKIWRINTFPPIGGKRFRLLFEKTLGRAFNLLLARTILVELRNTKSPSKEET